jgi:hypothetical protein
MQLGLVVDLESVKAIRGIELATDTPGFSLEIYGTDSPELPPDVTDPRWTHPADRAKVDAATAAATRPATARSASSSARPAASGTCCCGSPCRRPTGAPCACRM